MQYQQSIKKATLLLLLFCAMSTFRPMLVTAQQEPSEALHNDKGQRKFDHFFYQALNAKALGNYDEAIDLFQHCYALDSTNANVLVELGNFYNVLEEKNRALGFFQKAVAYDSDNYYYSRMLAGLSKELGLKQDVVDIYQELAERFPEKQELLFELANAYSDNGELQEAVDALNRLEKRTGISEVITLNKFRLYSLMKKKRRAFEEIEQIIEKHPDNPRYLVLMGDLYLEDKQEKEALHYYEQARGVDPDFPSLILSMVNFYEKSNNKEAAQAELTKAITGTAMDVETKMQLLTRYLGILQQGKQDLKQANNLFDVLFEQYPNNTQLNMIYGNVLLLQEDKEGAIQQFEIYSRANPTDPAGYDQLLRVVLPEEDLDKIMAVTREALTHLPQQPQFYFYLGAAHYQQENYEEALRIFQEGLEKAQFNNPVVESDFHGQIGDLNYFLGDVEEAFRSYEKALQLNPRNLPVLNNYSYYLSLRKQDLDKAEKMSGLTIKAEPMNPTYLDTYGWILFEQGSYLMAKIYIEKAINYSNDALSAEVCEHYGDVLFKTGDEESARQQWQKAKELGGDSPALEKKIETGTL